MIDHLPDKLENLDFSRKEGIQSILTLLNLIPEPAIIYQRAEDEVITANNPLFLLTNLGEKEFIGKSINELLPNINDTDPISGHNKEALLRHKIQPLIPVNVRIFALTQSNDILLITFTPETINLPLKQSINQETALIDNLGEFLETSEGKEVREILQVKLRRAASILAAELTCIYKASGDRPQLVQFASNDERNASEFPNILTSEDFINGSTPSFWNIQKPIKTYLQKMAASAGYDFLISVPLGHQKAKFGLFLAAGKSEPIRPNSLALSKLIAIHLGNLIEDQIATQNLRNLANRIKQVVKIQNEIISNLDEGVLILSPDLTVAEINPAAEAILGYANVEALRHHVDSILIGSESLRSAFSSAQQGIPTVNAGDLTLHHRNGKSFPAQVMMTPVVYKNQLLSVVVLIRDMSEEQQSQAARKQLEQRAILGEVTAIFAHEVRNPINAIMLSLQVMEENLHDDPENLKWIENMREECNKLLYLMENVLSFAKPLEYKMSSVNLEEIINKLLARWRPRLLRLNIDPYFETQIENPIVEGDPRALEQVFTNLISNAVSAMSEDGGSLGIKISHSEDEADQKFLKITITDSGHGIPDDIKAHLFKPFVTGSRSGTGLGLAITQRIINAHKGKIEVDTFTGGTIFKVFLVKMKEKMKL